MSKVKDGEKDLVRTQPERGERKEGAEGERKSRRECGGGGQKDIARLGEGERSATSGK